MQFKGSEAERVIAFIESELVNVVTGEPIVLADFQKDVIRDLFGPDCKILYFAVSRGNAKTTLLACISLAFLCLDLFYRPNVGMFSLTTGHATSDDGVYGLARAMVEASPRLSDELVTKISRNNNDPAIRCLWNNGVIRVIPTKSDSRALGGNYSLSVIDEGADSHWTESRVKYITGSQKLPGAKCVIISTPNSMASSMFRTRKKYLAGESSKFVHFKEISAPDSADISDPDVWRLANPAIDAGFLPIEQIEMDYQDNPEWMFRMFRLGQFEQSNVGEGWLGGRGVKHFDACGQTFTDEPVIDPDIPCHIGLDASDSDDWTAVVIAQKRNGKWYLECRTWQPEWSDELQDNSIDIDEVVQHVKDRCDFLNVQQVAYDPAWFRIEARDLAAQGYPMVEASIKSPATIPVFRRLFKLIMDEQIVWDKSDDSFRLQMLVGIPRKTDNGFVVYKKHKNQPQKIDALYALVYCLQFALEPEDIEVEWSWVAA